MEAVHKVHHWASRSGKVYSSQMRNPKCNNTKERDYVWNNHFDDDHCHQMGEHPYTLQGPTTLLQSERSHFVFWGSDPASSVYNSERDSKMITRINESLQFVLGHVR